MKRNVRRALSALLSVVMLLSLLVVPAGAAGETAAHTVWLVGDSTVSAFNDAYYYPRYGYGTQIGNYLDGTYNVQNLAVSGTSSTTFTRETGYATLFGESGIKAGDTLIIGFGHNDEKVAADDPAKHTTPNGDYKTAGSFANSLYENYIKKAQAVGAETIVCTPIVRRTSGSWSNNNLHVTDEGSYPDAVKTMLTDLTADGKATDVTVVDMTAITKDLYDTLTPTETLYLHAWTSSKETSVDNTHLNIYGAKVVARALLEAVQTANASRLATHVNLGTAPTKANDLVSNPDYVELPYAPPTTSSAQCEDYVAGDVHFKGTAMGYLGGAPTAANQVRETDENGNMHIAVKNNKGKITSAYDGIAMYYYQVPVGKTFTLTAKAKVNAVDAANHPEQAAFGLMARDDMYIDVQENALASDYVVAGTFGDGSANCFRRKSGKLEKPATLAGSMQVGMSYDLKIEYNGDGYVCTFGDEASQSVGYDYQLTAVDSEYVYVGMFCARSFDVTFSNIVLTVDGTELCNTTTEEVPFGFTVNGWKFADASGAASDEAVEGGKLTAITGVLDGSPADALVFAAVYGRDGKMTGVKAITPKTGEMAVDLPMNGGETAKVFVLHKSTLEPYGEAYSVKSGVAPVDPTDPGHGPIQVWDFAAFAEEDGELYTNRIQPATWTGKVSAAGNPNNEELDLNGLAFKPGGATERLYTDVEGVPSQGNGEAFAATYEDGYVTHGGLYCNGSGSSAKRYLMVKNVKAGDKIVAYIGYHSGSGTFSAGIGGAEQHVTESVGTKEFKKHEFVAKQDGDFKIWPNGGKPFYHRVMLVPSVSVSGAIDFPAGYTGGTDYTLKFVNQTTGDEVVATVDKTAKTYTAKLAPGYEYNATLSGVTGWGFTTATKRKTLADADVLTGATWNLTVESKSTYTYSGAITGFAQDYDVSGLKVTMTPTEEFSSNSDPVELTLEGMNFTATLEPTVVYTITMEGVNDYQVKTPASVTSEGAAVTQDITVERKPQKAASGSFVVLDVDDQFAPLYEGSTYDPLTAEVTKLTFKNVDDGYTYDATVADGGYSVDLRAGAYEAVATVDGYATKTHVVVDDKAVNKDLLFVSTATPAAVDYAADIYVGDSSKSPNFNTVTGAMAYIKRMTRTDAQRVTVHIAPGTYREQISIDSKNVTFVNDTPNRPVVLTWYYGIGYTYYSATGVSNTDSWYSAEKAFDKYTKPADNVARWGATVRVQAPGFRAEGITFENSFNRALTDEELVDGVEVNGAETIKVVREYGLDVTSKVATERAAALWVDTNNNRGDMTEFKNCRFLSSQDTVGTGKRMYFKDCYIEGMTDYICGPGDVVFDTCTLNWKGYSDQAVGGYITAPQTAQGGKGYLFRSCYVSADNAFKTTGGALGRTWGKQNTACTFLNTTLQSADVLTNATWVLMNADATFTSLDQVPNIKEYGTVLADGTAVDLTKREHQPSVQGTAPAFVPADYFGSDWTPYYYVAEAEGGVALSAAPAVTDNGDINLPHPGHTLTVGYTLTPEANNANDNSVIQWYRVKDAVETLVKTSTAADKTYQIQTADVGAQIKVTVTPRTMGGQTGEAMSYTVATAVLEGYDDPSGVVDPVLGTGVNVFLAGDSTVKDYSAAGMWNKGVLQAEGSWGEWLPAFFNDKVTVVDYAQGGRTTRSFIEQDDSLSKIDAGMKEGDFLFIQFGHNDCHTQDSRYVPLLGKDGSAQATFAEGGSYPDTVTYESDLKNSSGALILTAGTYTTYTGYLKQYLEVAKKHNATAVLMTPVARMYYTDGKIRPHHDATDLEGTSDNEYCKAVKWVYDWAVDQGGYNVVFIDNFQLTRDLFEQAYTDCAETDRQTYGKQLMGGVTEGTHNNKLGGLLWAGLVAQAIQESDMTISKAVQAPAQIQGKTPKGETAFTVNGSGVLTAYDMLTDYASPATYWQGVGQALFQAIGTKAAELNAPAEP